MGTGKIVHAMHVAVRTSSSMDLGPYLGLYEGAGMIVLVGGEKGGVGKTTLAVNLAAMRARAQHDVLLADADKQASANLWANIRDQEKVDPPVRCVQKRGKGLAADVRDLATRYEDIVIDAGGQDSIELRAAMTIA